MVPALIGQKIGMTQVFDGDVAVPVTIVKAGPCTVLQVRNENTDGYNAVQIGFGDVKAHRSTLPHIGHVAKAGTTPKSELREVRLDEAAECKPGDVFTVNLFSEAEVKWVDVIGRSKGRGFSGAMRRHGFGGQPASHGVERKHRSPGSISSHGSDLGHGGNVKKGKRMAGQYGNTRITVKSQKLIGIDEENHLLLVKGGIPGPNGSIVFVHKAKTKA
jgi:large subunit ribosomal protein L3